MDMHWRIAVRCVLVLALLLVITASALAQDDRKDVLPPDNIFHPYPDGGIPVGDFRLQDRSGQFIGTRDLRGKIWVAQFFYFPCNTCAKNTPTMKALQDRYRGKSDVNLVSISLTKSDLDTLQSFAADHEAGDDQWFILTGPDARVSEIVSECFYSLNFKKKEGTLGDTITHKTDFFLIGAQGIMVGYVDGIAPGAFDSMTEQIDHLRTRRRMEERIPIVGGDFPRFNAMLNSTCTILLLLGWVAIRLRYETLHKLLMLSALAVSAVFLASYLFYHFAVMGMEPTRFQGQGPARY